MRALPFALGLLSLAAVGAVWRVRSEGGEPIATGKILTPPPTSAEVASFPANMVASPDGKWLVLTNTGFRQQLSVLDRRDGRLVSRREFNGLGRNGSPREQLYFGIAFDAAGRLYVSRGGEAKVSIFRLGEAGELSPDGELSDPGGTAGAPHFLAGVAPLEGGGAIVARNLTGPGSGMKGEIAVLGPSERVGEAPAFGVENVGGYPLDVKIVGRRVFVTSERDGVVNAFGLKGEGARAIPVGRNPTCLFPSSDGLYVSASGSDQVALIDPASRRVVRTIGLRPAEFRGLPSCTPLGMCEDARNLYVALADLNAVAVVSRREGRVLGYLPAGWYPTSVALSPDGTKLFVANAKGSRSRNPNGRAVEFGGKRVGTYIQGILEGTVSAVDLSAALRDLKGATARVLANNGLGMGREARVRGAFRNPGIHHVIYIVKENRTFDNVFGDLPGGDPSLCLFPREVTPNQHALAERFGLLTNFHVCAEVSADGWNWSTSGMANEHTVRNTPFNYSKRGRDYDFEGENGGVKVDLKGLPDVGEAPGGYLWNAAKRAGVSMRNYGMFVGDVEELGPKATAPKPGERAFGENPPVKRALQRVTDASFRQFDMAYPDSGAFESLGIAAPRGLARYGRWGSTSRYAEWKREFDGYVKAGSLPGLTFLRLPRDHTQGTAAGVSSPRAMVADNDYAVGQVVEAVSRSPFWRSTAICVLEDDAQAGMDHIDAHRSIALVVSPYNVRGRGDARFYNTDSMLRTMELLLGIAPMNGYDAMADPIDVFGAGAGAGNAEAFAAIVPPRAILGEVNARSAYRSGDSARISRFGEESATDVELNDILWGSIKGRPLVAGRGRSGLRASRRP